jgi:general secretion pathway protein K
MTPTDNKSETKESGFALFVVLSFLLIAAAITTPFLASARIEALVSRNVGQSTKDKILLSGILNVAAVRYFELYQNPQARPIRRVYCTFSSLDLILEFQDQAGLIDLNAASADVLALGLESLGVGGDILTSLVNEVVRYRSVEARAADVSSASQPRNGYKHALFEHVEELNDLMVTAGISSGTISDIFTVHSGTGTIDEAAAPDHILSAIEKRPAIDRYFVVNNTRRTNAITVSIKLQRPNAHQTNARAVFGRGENGLGIKSISPNVFETKPQDKQNGAPSNTTPSNTTPCDAFFDPLLLQSIREVTA